MPMILIAMALSAQNVTLEADPAKAALTCARAQYVMSGEAPPADKDRLAWTGRMELYSLKAASPEREPEKFLDRLGAIAGNMAASLPTAEEAAVLMPQCERRFTVPARVILPKDALDRDFMCFAVLNLFVGMISRWQDPQDSDFLALDNARIAFQKRLPGSRIVPKGYFDQPTIKAKTSRELAASANLGDPFAVATACRALL